MEQIQSMIASFVKSLPGLAVSLFVFVLFVLLAQGVEASVTRVYARVQDSRYVSKYYRQRQNVGLLLGRLSYWGVVSLGLLVGMVILFPRFSPAQAIQLLGIGSVAIGFAFRDILQNWLSGILLLLQEPFHIGDQIVAGAFEGTVENIHTRATTVRTYDGRRVIIPNTYLYTNSVTVNTALTRRRQEQDFMVAPDTDIPQAKRCLLEAVRQVEGVMAEPAPEVIVVGLTKNGISLRARWWFTPPRHRNELHVRDRVLTAANESLSGNGVQLTG